MPWPSDGDNWNAVSTAHRVRAQFTLLPPQVTPYGVRLLAAPTMNLVAEWRSPEGTRLSSAAIWPSLVRGHPPFPFPPTTPRFFGLLYRRIEGKLPREAHRGTPVSKGHVGRFLLQVYRND